jgi:transcription termination factor NusB
MSDADQTPDPAPSANEPGPKAQQSASTTARIIREMDMMRAGYDAVLRGVSTSQLILEGPPGLNPQDQIKIKLRHVVQRFEKEVRGLVRTIEPIDAQLQRITVELFTRLTPIELSVLKMGVDASSGKTEKRWY